MNDIYITGLVQSHLNDNLHEISLITNSLVIIKVRTEGWQSTSLSALDKGTPIKIKALFTRLEEDGPVNVLLQSFEALTPEVMDKFQKENLESVYDRYSSIFPEEITADWSIEDAIDDHLNEVITSLWIEKEVK